MSVVAWDGRRLAADRQGTNGSRALVVTKMFEIEAVRDGEKVRAIVAFTGMPSHFGALLRWVALEDHETTALPTFQSTEDWSRLVVLYPHTGKVYVYEATGHPVLVEETSAAWGAGADFALGAMAAGVSAPTAVEITSRYSTLCGQGVDFFDCGDVTGRDGMIGMYRSHQTEMSQRSG